MRLSHLLADLAARKSDNIVEFHFFYHASYLIRCMDRPLFLIVVTLALAHGPTTPTILLLPFAGSISQRLIPSLKISCMILSQMLGWVTLQRDLKRQVCYHTCSFQPASMGKKPEKEADVAYLLRIMVSQPLGQRRSCLLFYIILVFILITTVSWLHTTTTYVSVTNIRLFKPYPIMSFVPADVYSQQYLLQRY